MGPDGDGRTLRYPPPMGSGGVVAVMMVSCCTGSLLPCALLVVLGVDPMADGRIGLLVLVAGVLAGGAAMFAAFTLNEGSLSFGADAVRYRRPALLPGRSWSCDVGTVASIHLGHHGYEQSGYEVTTVVVTLTDGRTRSVPARQDRLTRSDIIGGSRIARDELAALYRTAGAAHVTVTETWHALAEYQHAD